MTKANNSDVLGIDIGGANLKLSTASGDARSVYFPMWTHHQHLAARLDVMLEEFRRAMHIQYRRLAVTMTGEMADCFDSRAHGVRAILDHVTAAAVDWQVSVYTVDGSWLTPEAAGQHPWSVASSNWHALASWLVKAPVAQASVGPLISKPGLIVDIGSTTVDVIPVDAAGVNTDARTDLDRLRRRQLVYTGMSRTAIAAILSEAEIQGVITPLVAERFATSDDAYVVLGWVAADEPQPAGGQCQSIEADTADGRPRSVANARQRLARMLGEDRERLPDGEIESLARQVVQAQAQRVADAMRHNLTSEEALSRPGIIFSGHGRCLAMQVLERVGRPVESLFLEDLVSHAAARCAPATAVAWLLQNGEDPSR